MTSLTSRHAAPAACSARPGMAHDAPDSMRARRETVSRCLVLAQLVGEAAQSLPAARHDGPGLVCSWLISQMWLP